MENAIQPTFEEMRTLFTMQQRITSHLGLQVVIQLIADGARQLVGSQSAVLGLREGEELRTVAVSANLNSMAGLVGYRLPIEASLVGLSVQSGEAHHCLEATTIDGQADRARNLRGVRRSLQLLRYMAQGVRRPLAGMKPAAAALTP